MYFVIGVLFCIVQGILIGKFGWNSSIWSTLGFLIGLFSSANIILPILMGYPLSFYYLIKKEIKPKVLITLLYAPLFWCFVLFLLGGFFPKISSWMESNTPFLVGNAFGFFAILLTPIFKKGREDFKSDFDKSYGKFYIRNQLFDKEIKSLSKVYSNLFIESERRFELNSIIQNEEQKLKYLVLCFYISIKCVDDLLSDIQGTINKNVEYFSEMIAAKQFIDLKYTKTESIEIIKQHLLEFERNWGEGNDLEKVDEIITKLILITIKEKSDFNDLEKVNDLADYINSSLFIMREAYSEMMRK